MRGVGQLDQLAVHVVRAVAQELGVVVVVQELQAAFCQRPTRRIKRGGQPANRAGVRVVELVHPRNNDFVAAESARLLGHHVRLLLDGAQVLVKRKDGESRLRD